MSARRLMPLCLAGLACGLLAVAPGRLAPPVLVYNTTASVPVGFYRVDGAYVRRGDLALVRPPKALARWLAMRGYVPANVPLIKTVAATGGQRVCGRSGHITIDDRVVAHVLQHDRAGRPLRPHLGCRLLRDDEVFLLNARAPGSLDGRYFGPLNRAQIVGRMTPLWVRGGR